MFNITSGFDPSINTFSIEIKLSTGFLSTDKLVKVLPKILRKVVTEGKNFWHSEAGRRLKTSRKEYQDALYIRPTNGELGLSSHGWLASAVEFGAPSFDMKPGFLNAGKSNIPLNTKGVFPMRKPGAWARVTANSPVGSWIHPGLKGIHLRDEVIKQITNVILPKHLEELKSTL